MIATAIFASAVGLYVATAAALDFRLHRVPNWLTVPAAAGALLFHAFMPNGIGLAMSLAGLGVGFALLLIPALLGGGGMGDVKLLAALGAWLGPAMTLVTFVVAVVCAAMLALGVLLASIVRRGMARTQGRYLAAGKPADRSGQKRVRRVLPFAVPVCMGTWLILAWMIGRALAY